MKEPIVEDFPGFKSNCHNMPLRRLHGTREKPNDMQSEVVEMAVCTQVGCDHAWDADRFDSPLKS
jgi:hypothetical protein